MVFVLFAGVPLVASTAFWDQFASVKWYALQALAVVWLVVELVLCGSRGWPRALRHAAVPLVVLFALPLPGAVRLGLDWAAPPLAERVTVGALALCAFWCFRRNGRDLRFVRAGVLFSTAVTLVFGFAQALKLQLVPSLTAGDQRSALFGNVNMAAEFLGFAVIALLVLESGRPSRAVALRQEVAIVFALVELFFLASRSTFLALAVAVTALVFAGRLHARRLAALVLAAGVGAATFLGLGSAMARRDAAFGAEHLLRPDVQQHKRDSSTLRFAAWESTLSLVRDHPWGVGLGNFPDVFIPYQLEGSPRPDEDLYFRSPHNEALRLAAESGLWALPLAAGLGLAFARSLWRSPVVARGRSQAGSILLGGLSFYVVEAVFQFPLDVAFGAGAIAVLAGLGASCLEPREASARDTVDPRASDAGPFLDRNSGPAVTTSGSRRSWASRGGWMVIGLGVAASIGVTTWRVARSEWLYVNAPRSLGAQAEACRLNPRNLPACVTAAWLQGRAGDAAVARSTLTRMLERSPYYFPAIKLLGEQALARGERQAGCLYLWIYDELFRRTSSVHHVLGRYCEPAWFTSFRDTIPMPRYGAFPVVN